MLLNLSMLTLSYWLAEYFYGLE
uniref:Uncharacterized protein n=1 Tax=Arundo donax TaxID=35708 RepID=A0A0A9A6F6_ARUDO